MAVAIGLLPQYVPQAEAKGASFPSAQAERDPARGKNGVAEKRKANPVDALKVTRPAKVSWPEPGSDEFAVTTKPAKAEGLPLRAAASASGPDSVEVEVLDRKAAQSAGVDGVLLKVARTDGAAEPGKVKVELDYSGFAEAYGGGYGSRLRFVQYPECLLTTPEKKGCSTPRELKSTNATAKKTLAVTVDAAPEQAGVSPRTISAASTGSGVTLLAATAAASGDQGNYGATSLQPSSDWSVSNSSGAFNWTYPMRTPPVPGGLAPGVTLAYTSQSVDGQTASTNAQGSWVGQGFGYEPGFIERRYKGCAQDGHDKANGDQCWAFDNATIQLADGTSGEIIKIDTPAGAPEKWRLSNDTNSKIERLTGTVNGDDNGEHWRLTTTGGLEYTFGLDRLPGWRADDPATTGTDPDPTTGSTWTVPVNGDDTAEPCNKSTFETSFCNQAWRWNLSYVKDVHGNVMSYYYGKETNYYTQNLKYLENGKPYTRGGYLKRVDYGQRDTKVYTTPAPGRVVFTTDERCLAASTDCEPGDLTDATATRWPDVPWDRNCPVSTKCEGQNSPTFWTRKKLSAITTQIRSGTGYQDVDSWKLTHEFTDNGDGSKALWLKRIAHTGKVAGTASMPTVELHGTQLPNRIDIPNDNIQAMNRLRLGGVTNETGGHLSVVYAGADCSATSLPAEGKSTKRCYPVKWNPPGIEEPITDWFQKYVVDHVSQEDLVGGTPDMTTSYEYVGGAGWRKSRPDGITEAKFVTWGDWRGYGKVRVTNSEGGVAAATNLRTEHTFFRGLDGDVNPDGGTRSVSITDSAGTVRKDSDHLSGFELETATYNGAFTADKLVSKSISTPWSYVTGTRTQGVTAESRYIRPATTASYTTLTGHTPTVPKWQVVKSSTAYDTATGRATKVDDFGLDGDSTDNQCTITSYADNATKHMLDFPSRVLKTGTTCADTANHAKFTLSDALTSYDGQAVGVGPVKGDPTKIQRFASLSGTTPVYETVTELTPADFDAFGRPLKVKDADGTATTMQYSETDGLTTKKVETNYLGWQTTTEYNPAWGVPAAQTDPNARRTDLGYDALGRLTGVWLADRPKATSTPSIKYGYLIRTNDTSAVMTERLQDNGTYGVPEYTLYDGNLRPVQVQTEAADGKRMIADTYYNGLGQVVKTNSDYVTTEAPSGTRFDVTAGVNGQSRSEFDGAGRKTAEIFAVAEQEKWRTTYTYGGDRVHTDPPNGQAPTTTITDARGQTTEVRQYKGNTPLPIGTAADYVATRYTYTQAGQLDSVKDQNNNTWSYTYDKRGRKLTSTDPDAGISSYEYDALDRLKSTTNSEQKKISTVYDKLGRPTSTWEGEPVDGKQLTAATYDVVGKGQPYGSFTYANGTVYAASFIMSFDVNYQPLTTRYSISKTAEPELGGTYEYKTAYNHDGTVQSTSLPAAGDLPTEALQMTYDDLQRPTAMQSIYNSSGPGANYTYVQKAAYNGLGDLTQIDLSNGAADAKATTQMFAYELGTGRPTKSTVVRQGAAPLYEARYTYDVAGNVTSISDQATGGVSDSQCFRYDWQRRMTQSWTSSTTPNTAIGTGSTNAACTASPTASTVGGPAPYWRSYSFDDVTGNRKTETSHGTGGAPNTTRTYSYGDADQDGVVGEADDGGPHALTKVEQLTPAFNGSPEVKSQDTYKYDKTGNTTERLVQGNTQALTWNSQGKLSKVTGPKTTDYIYDGSGGRLLRNVAGEKTLYLPGMELRLDPATKAVTTTRYYAFGGKTVAMRTAKGVQHLAADHHGTAEIAVGAVTGEVTRRRMDPFGQERGSATGAWVNDKGFLGKTVDDSTGLVNIGAREYEPANGRFISLDPIIDYTDPVQMNGYAYANHNPVSLSDPTGLKPDECLIRGVNCKPKSGGGYDISKNEYYAPYVAPTPAEQKAVKARSQADGAKRQAAQVAKELASIAMEELGITDALDCFTTGALGSCGATIVNVATSFAGGIVGKLAAKYGAPWNWSKAVALGKRIWGLVGKLTSSLKSWYTLGKKADEAEAALANAVDSCTKKSNSFVPEEKVLMADGSTKAIKDVDIGDEVIATDPETGKTKIETVTAEIKGKGAKKLVKVTIDTDGSGGNKTASVTATDGHPFWVPELGDWIDATDLKSGDWLQTGSGALVQIAEVQRWTAHATVHNLTVSDLHTYYVLAGATPVLVHNCGGANGGKYGDLQPAGAGNEINHIPAHASTPLSKYSGPSIRMDYADHRAVYSTGSSLESKAWRMRQKELIDGGDFRGAMQMDVEDIRNRFGNKYDGAITEMWMSLSQNKALRKWASGQNP